MRQCELYFQSKSPNGTIINDLFPARNNSVDQREEDRCTQLAVDYIIVKNTGQKVYLCAEHYDVIQAAGNIVEYNHDEDDSLETVAFIQ